MFVNRRVVALGLAVAVTLSCRGKIERALVPPDGLAASRVQASKTEHLKAHLKSGELVVFDDWTFPDATRVTGNGVRYSIDRTTATPGAHTVSFGEVALFETNTPKLPPEALGLAVLTGISAIVTVACFTMPKACFGSCPTFYVPEPSGERLVAEGFSQAVAPSLEADDVDALWQWEPRGTVARLKMRNEALETHVVRRVNLLAVPRGEHEVVETTRGTFRAARDWTNPATCTAENGDCLAAVARSDGNEWFSESDGIDLAHRETLEIEFGDLPRGEKGLVLRFRQTFLTTFLFYQALAFLGDDATATLAELERRNVSRDAVGGGYEDIIGQIEVHVRDPREGKWLHVGAISETGPLARNTLALELGELASAAGPLEVRLDVARGNWRFDEVAIVGLGATREALVIEPKRVVGRLGDVTQILLDPSRSLVTLPGDDYELEFPLPPDPASYRFFLDSRGYYLEWIREEWAVEKNPAMALLTLRMPHVALRVLAPRYKELEPRMEKIFWESKYEN